MPIRHSPTHDVIIVGAGPVGLFLACELRLACVSVLVLEQAADPFSPFKALPFGMRGLSAPTLAALYHRDLLNAVEAAQRANQASSAAKATSHWMQQSRRPAGHFAGIQFGVHGELVQKVPLRNLLKLLRKLALAKSNVL